MQHNFEVNFTWRRGKQELSDVVVESAGLGPQVLNIGSVRLRQACQRLTRAGDHPVSWR